MNLGGKEPVEKERLTMEKRGDNEEVRVRQTERKERDGRSKNMNANLELSENLAFTRIL